MPFGKEVVVINTDEVLLAIVSDRTTDWVCAGVPESVIENPTAALLTAAVGVPEMTPVAAASVRPAGSVPLVSRHVYGAVPPDAARVAAYVEPMVPAGSDVVVTDTADADVDVPETVDVLDGGALEVLVVVVAGCVCASAGSPVSDD